ncbi:reverse transcriptase domain-containing protein [Dactylosporangium sp. NPDC048998]|uniref:reverse transcriptase domain-containing protein n=1 Tax=Dactylosporangium sp. NPDC048998 TaxID=3363976 RepID=UPI0037246874
MVAARLETRMGEIFHRDFYGYRPGRSALQAVARTKERCWRMDWVVDMDIAKFLRQRPVGSHGQSRGGQHRPAVDHRVCETLAGAPMVTADGTVIHRERGTPQGSAVSPALANLLLHYALDA